MPLKVRLYKVITIRSLRAILGVTHRKRIRNEYIWKAFDVTNMITASCILKTRLRGFGHVTRPPPENNVKQAYCQDCPNQRPRGRSSTRGSTRCTKMQGCPLLPQSVEPLIAATSVAQSFSREQGDGKSWALKSIPNILQSNVRVNQRYAIWHAQNMHMQTYRHRRKSPMLKSSLERWCCFTSLYIRFWLLVLSRQPQHHKLMNERECDDISYVALGYIANDYNHGEHGLTNSWLYQSKPMGLYLESLKKYHRT